MSSSAIDLKGAIGRDALRNLIANPAFDEWTRGLSFDITSPIDTIQLTNGPDNWFVRYFPDDGTTTDALVLEKVKHTVGQTEVEGNPIYFARIHDGAISNSTEGNEQITLTQRIPNVRLLQDETVSLSFYARGWTADMKLGIGFTQVFGISGDVDEFGDSGDASDPVSVQGQQVSLQTDWTKHNLRFNIPSITGKSIGTCGANYTELNFFVQAGPTAAKNGYRALPSAIGFSGDTLDIANVQLERGVDVSTFENIQQSNTFVDMIGAQVTAIASGQITKAASSKANAVNLNYSDITSLTATDPVYINLNDNNSSQNDILKFGTFHSSSIVTDPIYIVSPAVAGAAGNTDLEDIHVVAALTDDKRILEVTSYNTLETASNTNITFNVFAIQLGIGSHILAGSLDGAGPGSTDSTGGQDSVPGEDGTPKNEDDGTECTECQPL